MSNLSFEQATPVNTADASGAQKQSVEPQEQLAMLEGKLKEMSDRYAVTQKRVDDKEQFIQKLQAQIATLSEQAEKAKRIDEVFSHMDDDKRLQPDKEVRASLDPEELVSKAEARILAKLQAEKVAKLEEENFTHVAKTLAASFGVEGLDDKIKTVAEENGMSFDEATELAKKKPKVFLKLFSEDKPVQMTAAPHKSTINPVGSSKSVSSKEPDFNDKRAWMAWKMAQLQTS